MEQSVQQDGSLEQKKLGKWLIFFQIVLLLMHVAAGYNLHFLQRMETVCCGAIIQMEHQNLFKSSVMVQNSKQWAAGNQVAYL